MRRSEAHRSAPAPVRFRRVVRHWGLVILVAIGFLLMALLIRETDETAPAQSLPPSPTSVIA